MGLIAIVLIAVSLAIDCFAVSTSCGLQSSVCYRKGFKLSIMFAVFQAGLFALGWLLGGAFQQFIEQVDHWIAFTLLSIIGLKMIIEALQRQKEMNFDISKWSVILGLSVATAIDAFIVGIGLRLENVNLLSTMIPIFIITFIISMAGIYFGKKLSFINPRVALFIGGLVLIGLGIKVLYEHHVF